MDDAIFAALAGTIGFASGDVFTALLARRVSGKASQLILTILKVLLYAPLALLWQREYTHIDGQTLAWIVLLGVIFTVAYTGFNMAFQLGKSPALVGVVAGCFPASAAVVAIVFLGQRPSALTISLLVTVLTGVILIGVPEHWRTSFAIDKGILLALLPLVCWGVFGALLNEPVRRMHTPHAWFVVQSLVAVVMAIGTLLLYNKGMPDIIRQTSRRSGWKLAVVAGIIIGTAEALQAFSLSSGKEIVIIETLLGSYPAVYFLVAHKLFKERLIPRQWIGIAIVIVSIVLLSVSATS